MPDEVTGANSEGEPTGKSSFIERMTDRLSAERGSGEPTGAPDGYDDANPSNDNQTDKVGDGYEEALDPAGQAEDGDDAELQETEPTEEIDDPDAAITETSDDEVVLSDADKDLVLRAETAEQHAHDMERDYRIKTHKIAAVSRELEDHTNVVKKQAEFILNIAEQGVKQFDNVNWQQLQSRPEEYQRMQQMFNGAIMQRDQMKKQLGGIAEQHREMLDQAKSREAEVSKDILRSTVHGWNNELYGKLRAYAVEELSYTAEEFDDITDWRRLRDIHAQHQMFSAPKKIVKLRRKKGKLPANRQIERQTARVRGKGGEFSTARREFQNNPGPGPERHNFFQQKLAAERRR